MKKGVDYIGVGVGAAIFNSDGKLFIAKRGKKARNERGKWEIPGGSVEFGETFENAIKREIKEELDIEIEVLELLGICDHIIPDENQHWVAPTYICKIVKGTPKILEPEKCSEISWFALEEAEKLSLSIITKRDISLLKERFSISSKIMYNTDMAKRNTGVGKKKKTSSYKTKKRLEKKREMLATKAAKRKK